MSTVGAHVGGPLIPPDASFAFHLLAKPRVDKGGKGSFDRVMERLGVLQRHEADWNALTTVHAANQHAGREVYRFLRDDWRRAIRAVHPDHRADDAGVAARCQRGLGRARA